jgi:demethoxyubiquinone hydroxylase (CLK1/Coq7/Cat5 family)
MASSGMLRCEALVRTDVSEKLSASIIRVSRIGELGTLAITSNQCMHTLYFFAAYVGC